MENQGVPRAVVFVLLGGILLFIFGSQMYTNIQPGQKGVKFYTLGDGLDTETTYGQGMNFYFPWNKMIVYDVKTQMHAVKVDGKDTNGVQCALAMNIIYHPVESEIGLLHNEVGEDYLNKLIKPKIGDIALTVIKEYTYDQIISHKKDELKIRIEKMMQDELAERHITIEEIKISDIIISTDIERAITEKVEAEQLALKQQYVLDKELQEAERKRIEAQGISDFQSIVNQTITAQLLKWKGIEATQEIAKSTNSKVIVIGNGDGDLPIILGGDN